MTNTELIRQEIERRLKCENELLWNAKLKGTVYPPSVDINLLTLTSLRDFIDSLPQEEPEVDLEKEWEEFEDWIENYNLTDYPTCYEPKQIARHFYELGLNARKEE